MASDAVEDAAARLGGLARREVPIGPMTTYRVGGAAALFVELTDATVVAAVQEAVAATGVDVLAVGKGSNLLVADRGFVGLAVTLGEGFTTIEVLEGGRVRTGAAVSLPVLARRTAAASLTGFEWAVGVPGSVGGAVRMNAGGHGSDMAAVLRRYVFVDLRGGPDGEAPVDALRYSYRHSSIEPHQVVMSAELELASGDRAASEAEISEIVRWRREHQPGGQNAGSIFTNPEGDSAGRLIEAAGLKGFRRGSAYVSPKHANFFQADEGGSADDVRRLIEEVQQRVEDETDIRLSPELRMVGFASDPPAQTRS
ncbi:MAG TPA: UDP-N-acetylmuramate dehydrogenase [Acidimicrobiales bacterium]|nr:UDP-N-acetylmuramate dehydrogenase [Acidimicrobiales bacterium]